MSIHLISCNKRHTSLCLVIFPCFSIHLNFPRFFLSCLLLYIVTLCMYTHTHTHTPLSNGSNDERVESTGLAASPAFLLPSRFLKTPGRRWMASACWTSRSFVNVCVFSLSLSLALSLSLFGRTMERSWRRNLYMKLGPCRLGVISLAGSINSLSAVPPVCSLLDFGLSPRHPRAKA